MKKVIYVSALALMLSAASCSKSENSGANDSVADSVATDTVSMVDSAANKPAEEVAEDVNPEEALTLTVEKKNLNWAGEDSYKTGTWTLKVTNNGNSEVKGTDYVVAYNEIVEDTVNGELVEATKNRTAEGKDVMPGESVTITLKARKGCQDFKNPRIVNAKK